MNLNTPVQVRRQEISASLRRKFVPHKRKASHGAKSAQEESITSSISTRVKNGGVKNIGMRGFGLQKRSGDVAVATSRGMDATASSDTSVAAGESTCTAHSSSSRREDKECLCVNGECRCANTLSRVTKPSSSSSSQMTGKDEQNTMKTNHHHDYDQRKQKDERNPLVKVKNPYIKSARKPSLKRPRYFTPKQTPRMHQETIWNPYKNEYQVMLSASTPYVKEDHQVNGITEEKIQSKLEHVEAQVKKQSPYRRRSNNQTVVNPYVKTPQSRQNLAQTPIKRQRSSVNNPYTKKSRLIASIQRSSKPLQDRGTHISLPTPPSLAMKSEPVTHERKLDTFSPQAQSPTQPPEIIQDNFISNNTQKNEEKNKFAMVNEGTTLLSGRIEKAAGKYEHALAGLYTIAQAQKFLKPHSTIKETHLRLPKIKGAPPRTDGAQSHIAMTRCHLAPSSSRFQPVEVLNNSDIAELCDASARNASKVTDSYSFDEETDIISARSLPLKQSNAQSSSTGNDIVPLEKGMDGNETNSTETKKGRDNRRNFFGNRRLIAMGKFVRNKRQRTSANYLKKDLSIGNRSDSLIESPKATRRPYPLPPTQNAPLASIPLLEASQQAPWEFHFLANAKKAANNLLIEVNSNKSITERLILSASYYSRCHHKTVRLMGCISTVPENILYQEGSKKQGPQKELMSFVFDDGTSHIDAICIKELLESRSDKWTPRIPKLSDFVDCIGYIQHISCKVSAKVKAGSTLVFMIEDMKFIDDPALETLRMMNVMSKEDTKLQQTQIVSSKLMGLKAQNKVSSSRGHVANPDSIEDSFLDTSRMLELIEQSKPQGLSEDEIAVLLDVRGDRGMNSLRNGLKRLQLDLQIHETGEGSYAPK